MPHRPLLCSEVSGLVWTRGRNGDGGSLTGGSTQGLQRDCAVAAVTVTAFASSALMSSTRAYGMSHSGEPAIARARSVPHA
jgi:hypothetical protein